MPWGEMKVAMLRDNLKGTFSNWSHRAPWLKDRVEEEECGAPPQGTSPYVGRGSLSEERSAPEDMAMESFAGVRSWMVNRCPNKDCMAVVVEKLRRRAAKDSGEGEKAVRVEVRAVAGRAVHKSVKVLLMVASALLCSSPPVTSLPWAHSLAR
jgi:hypothetical protein